MDDFTNKAISKFLDFVGGTVIAGTVAADIFLFITNGLPFRAILISAMLVVIGAVVLFCGLFWEKLAPAQETLFTAKLGKWAASPGFYLSVMLLLWGYLGAESMILAVSRNNELAGLRNDEQSMAKVIDRLVMPRHLTELQRRVIRNFLSQYSAHEFSFRVPSNYEESMGYVGDISRALTESGWTLYTTDPYVHTNDIPEGVNLSIISTPENAQKPRDIIRNPNAMDLLQIAFGLAGVRVDGSGTGSSNGATVTEDRVVISIGRPRTDNYPLLFQGD
jgi:hypothetical protein